MRRYELEDNDVDEDFLSESDNQERDTPKNSKAHFESTYTLKPNEKYEANQYRYETDRYGRITQCEGTLRLEDGKRNTDHQTRAGGEYRLEKDEGGHLIGKRFGGSEKLDNIVAMDYDVNHGEYLDIENDWAEELADKNQVDVKITCLYEGESTRPSAFIVKYRVTYKDGSTRIENKTIPNTKSGGS